MFLRRGRGIRGFGGKNEQNREQTSVACSLLLLLMSMFRLFLQRLRLVDYSFQVPRPPHAEHLPLRFGQEGQGPSFPIPILITQPSPAQIMHLPVP